MNSITLFSKCHHGWAYHPSAANDIHPHLEFDLLKAQIEAAHEIGVKHQFIFPPDLMRKLPANTLIGWHRIKKEHGQTQIAFPAPAIMYSA